MGKNSKRKAVEDEVMVGDDDAPYFQDETVTVTKTRAIIGGVTYAMANVTSVRMFVQPKPPAAAIVAAILMLLGLGSAKYDATPQTGIGITAAGAVLLAVYLFVLKPKYWVRIGNAGAESNAAWSNDPAWTQEVVQAINEAIIDRG